MINCSVFFSDPILLGRVSSLVNQINSDVHIEKCLDQKQLCFDDISLNSTIFISDLEGIQALSQEKSNQLIAIIIIDEEGEGEGKKEQNRHYLTKKSLLTKLSNILMPLINSQLDKLEYIPIQITKFKIDIVYPCDIYLKLSKLKKIRILNAGSLFDYAPLQKLILKHVKFLFVKSTDYTLIKNLLYTVQDDELIDSENPITSDIFAIESVDKYIKDLGFDSAVLNMTKKIHGSLEDKFTQKIMTKLFERFKRLEGSFLYNHSYLTSVIALSAGKNFTWMSYDNREKIYLGCILHDLGYKDSDNAIKENLTKKEILELSKEEQEDILSHPVRFAEKISKVTDIHQDVIKIVRDHHGIHGDQSYPKAVYATEVNLIFALFILSHEFTLGLYSIMFNQEKIPALLESTCARFDNNTYRKIIPGFKKSIQDVFL